MSAYPTRSLPAIERLRRKESRSASLPTESTAGTSSLLNEQKRRISVIESDGFSLGRIIGHGSYAVVKEAYSSRHKGRVAIKIISKRKAPSVFIEKFLPRELLAARELNHPNVVKCLFTLETTHKVYLVMEICDNGDLLEIIKMQKYINEEQAGEWFRQLFEGVSYIHSRRIAHRDLKCENLLLCKHNHLKIADFGFSRPVIILNTESRSMSETYCGSFAYASPEIISNVPYDPQKADIWSMGVVLYTMVFGVMPFDDSNPVTLKKQVSSKVDYPLIPEVSNACRSLITDIFTPVMARPSLNDMKRYAWFESRCILSVKSCSGDNPSYPTSISNRRRLLLDI